MGLRDYIREADRTEDLMLRFKDMPGGPVSMISTRVRRLDAIVNDLRKNAFAPEIKLFGDAADDSEGALPSSIDVFVDYTKIPLGREIASNAMGELLAISRNYRGMLNPYILVKGKLYTKDDDSYKWIRAKDQQGLVSAGKQGLPLTLFDKNFTSVAYAGLSESTMSIKGYINRAEERRGETVMYEGQLIPARLLRDHTPMEIAMILGGH